VAEAVSCQLPTVMIQTAENQEYNFRGWIGLGCAIGIQADGIDTELPEIMRLASIKDTRRELGACCKTITVGSPEEAYLATIREYEST